MCPKPKNMKHRAHILNFLKRNRLMSLATSSKNMPWAATVFFAYDTIGTIFFYSRKDTRHCRNIAKNPNVAITFNQYTGKPNSIKGLQIIGRASEVASCECARCYAIFTTRYPWAKKFSGDHTLYAIHPKEMYYIDQKLFKHFYRVRIK